jgi:flagellar FliL protein
MKFMAEAIPPVKKRKTFLLVVGLVVLLVVIAAAVAFFLIRNKQLESYRFEADPYTENTPVEEAPPPPASNSAKHVFAALEMFTANLADRDRDRFAQVGVMIELGDVKVDSALKAVLPIIRSEILLLLSSKSADELLTLQGKQTLAQEILDIARKQISPEFRSQVYAVHFSSFVIQ